MTKKEQTAVYLKIKDITRSKDVQQECMLESIKTFDDVPTTKELKKTCNRVKTRIKRQHLYNKGLSQNKRPLGRLIAPIKSTNPSLIDNIIIQEEDIK